jgi:hypothetical protein
VRQRSFSNPTVDGEVAPKAVILAVAIKTVGSPEAAIASPVAAASLIAFANPIPSC